MKHMTNLYDKEFFIDRVKDMLQYVLTTKFICSECMKCCRKPINATGERHSRLVFFFTFWQMIFEFKSIVSLTKTKQKHPPQKKPTKQKKNPKTTKLSNFYRAIRII